MPLGKCEHYCLYGLSVIGAGSFGLWQGSGWSGLWMYTLFVLIHLSLTLFLGNLVVVRARVGEDGDAGL